MNHKHKKRVTFDLDGKHIAGDYTGEDLVLPAPSEAACSSSSTLRNFKFFTGMRIRVKGFTKPVHLNGLVGHCAEYNDKTGRWQVLLGEGDTKYIRPECLEDDNVPMDLLDSEAAALEEDEQKALEESLSAGPEDSDDSDDTRV